MAGFQCYYDMLEIGLWLLTDLELVSAICRIPEIVSDSDLKFLVDNLDKKLNEDEKWENVIDKKTNFLSYKAKCCKLKVLFTLLCLLHL